jgi:hypothetical protein
MMEKYGESLGDREIQYLFELYNKRIFQGELKIELEKQKKSLRIQMTPGSENMKAGGWCKTTNDGFILSFPLALYQSLFLPGEEGGVKNGGLVAYDRLGALQLTMEHELIHLIIQLTGNRKKGESHGKLFRFLVHYYFGQTECKHDLGLGDPSKWSKLSDFQVNDYVQIEAYKGGAIVEGRVVEILIKKLIISKLSDGSPIRVSPKMLKKIPTPSLIPTMTPNMEVKEFAIGDYVRTKRMGNMEPFCAIVRAKLIKFILVQKKASNQQFNIRPMMLEKISEEEYGDLISDVPFLRKDFSVGDYVKFTFKCILLYGKVEKKMPKNIKVSYTRDGVLHNLSGDPSLFTLVEKSEFLANSSHQ